MAVDLEIGSNADSNFKINAVCSILENITQTLPHILINKEQLKIPDYIQLADPDFHVPNKIDMLLGADIYFKVLKPDLIRLGSDLPVLQNTSLGWVVAGSVPISKCVTNLSVTLFARTEDVNELIPKFWNLEEVTSKRLLSPEDKLSEQIFVDTTKRLENGSFQVNLPFRVNDAHLQLGDSYSLASRRFFSLEKRLLKDEELHAQYKGFIKEYVDLGHAKYIQFEVGSKIYNSERCFLPHHGVVRESSTTTKLRVVFDASMKTSSGVSLNDLMLKGFPVQPELFDILCRFRTFNFVIIADIQKMYRMIRLNPEQMFLQNILWRDNKDEPLKCIELQTVTYGTKSAPYLATRCLKQLAEDELQRYPLAAEAILNQCYVDDILAGCNNEQQLLTLKEQLTDMLGLAGFKLHKWCSNSCARNNNKICPIRELFQRAYYIKTEGLLHARAQSVLSNLRLRYWPIHGLREVKSVIKNCVVCHRLKANAATQLMGSLPKDRVSVTRAFEKKRFWNNFNITYPNTNVKKKQIIRDVLNDAAIPKVLSCYINMIAMSVK
ncbi:hypothetical protein NQ315_013494 [Exocentrus adspersus]|uniref:Reverse transcriptase domain-containing protein n=1 Tax=Exocentrus adspersus TaxID=1586481 RepID=A0AAV8V8L8_9CUCU|nr:hypothetical protein NQ315_013494 [Exocentrus adspersus]